MDDPAGARVSEFIAGASFLASAAIATWFVTRWARDRARLFLGFAIAFGLLALHYLLLPFFLPDADEKPAVYLIRLAAFGVIIGAVADLNRRRAAPQASSDDL